MRSPKKILSLILAICGLACACMPAGAEFYHASVEINGVRYKLGNPGQYYDPGQVERISRR